MKCEQPCPGFEIELPFPFSTTIIIILKASPKQNDVCISSLLLLVHPLWFGVVVPVKFTSISQIVGCLGFVAY